MARITAEVWVRSPDICYGCSHEKKRIALCLPRPRFPTDPHVGSGGCVCGRPPSGGKVLCSWEEAPSAPPGLICSGKQAAVGAAAVCGGSL